MDRRTERLFDALQAPGAALLDELLRIGPSTEDELLKLVPGASQSTANRRLATLEDLGVLVRARGAKHSRDRPWMVAFHEEAESLVRAALAVSDAVAAADLAARDRARADLESARTRRAGLRLVDEAGGPAGGA